MPKHKVTLFEFAGCDSVHQHDESIYVQFWLFSKSFGLKELREEFDFLMTNNQLHS
jgi:hypothetical protein